MCGVNPQGSGSPSGLTVDHKGKPEAGKREVWEEQSMGRRQSICKEIQGPDEYFSESGFFGLKSREAECRGFQMDLGNERGKPPFITMPEMYVWWQQAALGTETGSFGAQRRRIECAGPS